MLLSPDRLVETGDEMIEPLKPEERETLERRWRVVLSEFENDFQSKIAEVALDDIQNQYINYYVMTGGDEKVDSARTRIEKLAEATKRLVDAMDDLTPGAMLILDCNSPIDHCAHPFGPDYENIGLDNWEDRWPKQPWLNRLRLLNDQVKIALEHIQLMPLVNLSVGKEEYDKENYSGNYSLAERMGFESTNNFLARLCLDYLKKLGAKKFIQSKAVEMMEVILNLTQVAHTKSTPKNTVARIVENNPHVWG